MNLTSCLAAHTLLRSFSDCEKSQIKTECKACKVSKNKSKDQGIKKMHVIVQQYLHLSPIAENSLFGNTTLPASLPGAVLIASIASSASWENRLPSACAFHLFGASPMPPAGESAGEELSASPQNSSSEDKTDS